jgi:RNA polymerase sigma-70 factor, ECF subfamily
MGASEIRKVFDRTVLPQLDVLYAVALQFTGSAERASDACRETFARAYNLFPASAPAGNRRVWLLKILFLTLREPAARSQNGLVRTRAEAPERVPDRALRNHSNAARSGSGAATRSEHLQVQQLLRTLPEEYRAALLLVEVAELSYEESAGVLEVTIEAVRSRVSHARLMMLHGLSPAALRLKAGRVS